MNLSTRQRIDNLFLQGKSFYSPYFKAKYCSSPDSFQTIITTKKQFPHAVDRNRAKRRVVSILRKRNLPNVSFAILLNNLVLEIPYPTLESELNKFIQLLQNK